MSAGDRNELLAAVDLQALFVELVGPPRHRSWPCPNPDHAQTGATPPVSITETVWKCHGCGAAGTAIDLLTLARGVTVAEAFADLRRRTGIVSTYQRRSDETRIAPPGPEVRERFLEQRQWHPDTAARFGLAPVWDSWGRPRIRFPFRLNGETRTYQDRATEPDQSPKWLTPTGAELIPFNVDALTGPAVAEHRAVWLMEGPADTVALADVFPDAAVLGAPGVSTWKPQWSTALAGLTVAVVADNDAAGHGWRRKLDHELRDSTVLHVHVPDQWNDLDDWRRAIGNEAMGVQLLEQLDGLDHLEVAA